MDDLGLSRRDFVLGTAVAGVLLTTGLMGCSNSEDARGGGDQAQAPGASTPAAPVGDSAAIANPKIPQAASATGQGSEVFFTTDIRAAGLVRAFEALGRSAAGKKVAVKISTGEAGNEHYLHPELIGDLIQSIEGTIVECGTAYGGARSSVQSHRQVIEEHGFNAIAPVVLLDEDGEMSLPVVGGTHLQEDIVGSKFADFDYHVVLSHFKGHQMGGYGGALKNMSIGYASAPAGKCLIHTAGANSESWMGGEQDAFLESMAEAAKAIADSVGENIVYINVMNNLSIDCDCNGHPAAPAMADVGILASLDPVALDEACLRLVYDAPEGKPLVDRVESRNGIHVLEHAVKIGLGNRAYYLIAI